MLVTSLNPWVDSEVEGVAVVVAVQHLNFKEEVTEEWLKYYFN